MFPKGGKYAMNIANRSRPAGVSRRGGGRWCGGHYPSQRLGRAEIRSAQREGPRRLRRLRLAGVAAAHAGPGASGDPDRGRVRSQPQERRLSGMGSRRAQRQDPQVSRRSKLGRHRPRRAVRAGSGPGTGQPALREAGPGGSVPGLRRLPRDARHSRRTSTPFTS